MGLDIFVKNNRTGDSRTNWRKINFLMSFLEEYGFDLEAINGSDVDFTEEMTTDLLERIAQIKQIFSPHATAWKQLAVTLLPTSSGFFFGSIEYDMHYIYDLNFVEQTILEMKEETGSLTFTVFIWY